MLIVQKFGGSSLADIDKLRGAAQRIIAARQGEHQVAVVVSAMGDTTDDLLKLAKQIDPAPSLRELDALLACGEQQSAALMAMMLESLGVPAMSLSGRQAGIYTDSLHGGAGIRFIAADGIEAALAAGRVAVITGFQGVNSRGDVTTLGRGGSDTTAVALAADLGADSCEIYTDVKGIYTADPRLVENPRLLENMDSRDMLLLSRSGSQVLHSGCVELALRRGLELRLLPADGRGRGTAVRMLPDRERAEIAGVTRSEPEGTVSVVGRGAGPLLVPRLFAALDREGICHSLGCVEEGAVHIRAAPGELLHGLNVLHGELFG